MRQSKHVGRQATLSAVTPLADEEEFVLELTALDGKRLQGYVLHPRSGRREAITDWEDLTRTITRMLATTDSGVMSELD